MSDEAHAATVGGPEETQRQVDAAWVVMTLDRGIRLGGEWSGGAAEQPAADVVQSPPEVPK